MQFNEYPYRNLEDLNLDYILKKIKTLITQVESLEGWTEKHEREYEELKALYDAIIRGHFPPEMKAALYRWCVDNTVDIIGGSIASVFFDITDDGYFKAIIPSSWSEIQFATSGLDTFPVDVDFGHLTLKY